jgi:hypothetical protein
VEDPDSTGQIVGARRTSLKGAQNESLLSYHRPLTDGDSVEYDFLYEPGRQITHPAMDRLAFIVNPDRVRFHWITDGRYDRTELPPDNLFEEVEGTLRRVDPEAVNGSDDKKLPLRPGEWNHAKLTLSGNSAALEINGHRVCERILPSNSRRTFGLFYDIGEEGVRVRNVVMKGNWPEVLPSTAEQELADRRVAELDKGLPALKSVFKNDFAKDGVSNLIEICNLGDLELTLRSDGAYVGMASPSGWHNRHMDLPFEVHGDFDFAASFDQLKLDSDQYACSLLDVQYSDKPKSWTRVVHIVGSDGLQSLKATLPQNNPDGSRSYDILRTTVCEATSGRFRIARRGKAVHYLFAEGDSDTFQIISTAEVSDEPIEPRGMQLGAICSGTGELQVLWKGVTLRAEKLMIKPPRDQRPERLSWLMNADGTNRRLCTKPVNGLFHVGSPEWSTDGKTIVCDLSRGTTGTARIYLFDADGSNPRDLGAGSMSSLSPDGKQIVFNRGFRGIMIMNSDGSNRRVLSENGFGVLWSPDGKTIAWSTRSNNMALYDVATETIRPLLTDEQAQQAGRSYQLECWVVE